MESADKKIIPFYRYVASCTVGSVLEPILRQAASSGSTTILPDSEGRIRILAMVLATCGRAGLANTAAIPMLLFPDDATKRQDFVGNPESDAAYTGIQAALKMHKMQSETYKAQDMGMPSIMMAILTIAAGSTGSSMGEFLSGEEDFLVEELLDKASACGQYGLLLAAVNEEEARNLIADALGQPWNFDEAGHMKYTDSLLQFYQDEFQVKLA